MTYLKTINLGDLSISPSTTAEEFEEIATSAKKIHQSVYCGGDLLNVLDQMYHFKNGRNYYGGKTIENISALKSLIQNSIDQKFDPFNAIPAILLNITLPSHLTRTEAIMHMSTGATLDRELTCKKDLFFLHVMDYLPLHNMFALMAGDDLKTLNDHVDDKLMTMGEIDEFNKELTYFQLKPVTNKLTDKIIVNITVSDKLLKAINSKLSKVDVGLVYGQYAGINIPLLRNRLMNVA